MIEVLFGSWETYLAVTIFLFFTFFWNKKKAHKWRIPLALPEQCNFFLGHALLLDTIEGVSKLCVDSATEDGISRFSIVGKPAFSVLKAEHVKVLLNSSNYRNPIPLLDKHGDMFLGPKALVFLMKDEWKTVRKAIARAFNWEYLRSMIGDINTVSKIFVQSLSQRDGQTMDIWPLVKCATIDIIGRSAFDYDFNSSASLIPSREAEAFEYLLNEMTRRSFKDPLNPFNYYYSLPSENNRQFRECATLIRDTITSIVERRMESRRQPAAAEHADMLKHMLDAFDEDKCTFNPAILADNLLTILFAGYDTSSITLCYAFYMMAKHPEVASRCRAEVQAAVGGEETPLSYEDITTKLPYCTAVINEVLRLFPPAPVTTRDLEEPLELQINETTRELIPAGTMLYIPIWCIHRSAFNYDNPDVFDPDRFYDPDRAKDIHRFAHLPFSGGGRDCVGRRFAMIEAVAIFGTVIRSLAFECPEEYQLKPVISGFVQKPEGGITLRVKKLS